MALRCCDELPPRASPVAGNSGGGHAAARFSTMEPMMIDELREKVAHAMWLEQAKRAGTPSVIAGRTPMAFANTADQTRREWLGYADAALAAVPAPAVQDDVADWRDDPTADDRWNAGCDFAMSQLCAVLGVNPNDVSWDAATEELEGDVRSVIGNIITAAFGDDWPTRATIEAQAAELERLRTHTAAQPAPDAVAEVVDALGNIAAMGYSDDPAVQANIARMAVEMARSARSAYFKGPSA